MLPPYIEIFIYEKHKNLNFWWHFKVPQPDCLWANFSSFGQILLHWQWHFSSAWSLVEIFKPRHFWTMSPNITCSVSLESYNPYLHPEKVSKNPKIHRIHSSLSNNAKSHFGSLGSLGIN
jgi:hypothetical protein